MKYQLQNEKIIVTVASKGAEMQSMIKDGQEYLWNGDETYNETLYAFWIIINRVSDLHHSTPGLSDDMTNV